MAKVKNKIKQKGNSIKKKQLLWALKITIASFSISLFLGLSAQFVANKASIYILMLILLFFVTINILFDGVAIATTTCSLATLNAMASRKVKNAKSAVYLSKRADKVASICADVIGDIAGILSGVCMGALVVQISRHFIENKDLKTLIFSAIISAIISAVTVGGKAFFKSIAMKNSLKYVMFCAKFISLIRREDEKKKKKKKKKSTMR